MALVLVGSSGRALAFDFFGLWGSDDAPPPVSASAIPYSVKFDVKGGDGATASTAQDASILYKLRKDAPPDGDALARRAAKDFEPLVDALWASGYYDVDVSIRLDDAQLKIGKTDTAAFVRAAEAHRNRSAAPITVSVTAGPLFVMRSIEVFRASDNRPFPPEALPAKIVGAKPGDPAKADELRAAQTRMIDYFRGKGHPFAKVTDVKPVVDHAAHVMDLIIVLDEGPSATFGEAAILGPRSFDSSIVRSYLYLNPGDPYTPKAEADAKQSIAEIPAVGGVRVTEADKLDANGQLPLTIGVTDRLPYAVGASAKYSTTEGPAAQTYWEDRNLFGGAERLRLSADIFYAPPNDGLINQFGTFKPDDIGGRLAASFLKPALGGSRNDLLIDVVGERTSTNNIDFIGYTVRDVDGQVAIRHRFSDEFSIQAGLEAQRGTTTDVLGTVNYTLIGIPVSAIYDTTDSKLDPTRGFKASATETVFSSFLGSSVSFEQTKLSGATYYSFDGDGRYVLAGRVGLGSLDGAALDEIPANWRFYAGGGGTIRGYNYLSVGPTGPGGAVVGGRSLFDTSAELRVKVTDTIGIVPFFDAGDAFASSIPDFSGRMQMAAGLGLRYYTGIGPIRLDVAAPLNRRPGDPPVAVYVSIGQAF